MNRSDSLPTKAAEIIRPWGKPRSGKTEGAFESGEQLPPSLSASALSRCSSAEARALLPLDVSQRLKALPLSVSRFLGGEVVTCAVPLEAADTVGAELRFALGRDVHLERVPEGILEGAIVPAYHGDADRLTRELEALRRVDGAAARPVGIQSPQSFHPESGEAARFLATLIEYAIAHEASDLHIVPKREGSFARLRVNGELRSADAPLCSLQIHAQLMSRLKVLANLDTTIRTTPLDGAFRVPRGTAHPVSVRVSIVPTIHGEKAVLRFLAGSGVRELSTLGLSPRAAGALARFLGAPEGAAIFAGPTGSGKSTTIYAALSELGRRNRSVVSIEDPVEVEIPGVTQTSLAEKTGLDYPTMLRGILRQDPDVIALGEIRDGISAVTAFQAALTGHLVLSTVHARNASEVVARLSHLGVDRLTLAQALRLIVCQRLIPLLCPRCKVIDLASSAVRGACTYRAVGCSRCDYSGFGERHLATEALVVRGEIAMQIASNARLNLEGLDEETYTPLSRDIAELLHAGLITPEQFDAYGGDW